MKTSIGKGVQELYESRKAIYASVGTSFLVCIVFIYLMSYLSELFIYLSIFAFWFANAFGCYIVYDFVKDSNEQISLYKGTSNWDKS
jgi:uncharacterized membrane protein